MSKVDALLPEHIKSSLKEVEHEIDSEVNMIRVPFKDLNQFLSSSKVHVEVVVQGKDKASCGIIQESTNHQEIMATDRSVTPSNEMEVQPGAPLTPTANLKILFNAMSPELRNRDSRCDDYDDEHVEIENDYSECVTGMNRPYEALIGEPRITSKLQAAAAVVIVDNTDMAYTDLSKYGSRKEKSLGLLCQKFLQKYPEYPTADQNFEICLDEVAKELQVERRRIYDIVNVLESVEIVSRVAKNKYAWHGKTNLQTTLAKLKALGDSEGLAEQIQKLKDFEINREIEEQMGRFAPKRQPTPLPDFSMFGESSLFNNALRKDKSLGIMSQKFLMLFLVSQPKTVNLDLSAKILIGDATIDKTESAKFKTKIRRLYDIANILTSLDLIRKVHVTEIRGRKPAFKYIGPDIDNCDEVHNGCHRPTSRHSMLDCVQNQHVANIMSGYRPIKPSSSSSPEETGKTTDSSSDASPSPTKSKFGRHSSFESICAVAEHERKKLIASTSEPASPVQSAKSKKTKEKKEELAKIGPASISTSPEAGSTPKQFILMQSSGGQFRMVEDKNKKAKMRTVRVTKEVIENKLPTKGFVRKKPMVKTIPVENAQPQVQTIVTSSVKSTAVTEKIIIKTAASKSTTVNGKQPTVIPLTKDQIDAVLRSLKVPVPVVKEAGTLVDAATQSSPAEQEVELEEGVTTVQMWDPKEVNETTPITYFSISENGSTKRQAPACDAIPMEKRMKLEFPSPPTSEDDKSPSCHPDVIKIKRKSSEDGKTPQRALHLTPEFNNPPNSSVGHVVDILPAGKSEIELAVPLPSATSSGPGISKVITVQAQPSGSAFSPVKSETQSVNLKTIQGYQTQTVTVQLPNRAPTVLHLPIVNMASQVGQQVHIIQGGSNVNSVVAAPQQVGMVVPCTFSPPLTPGSSDQTNQALFSFPTTQSNSSTNNNNNITFTNVHLIGAPMVKFSSSSLIRPIATKPVSSTAVKSVSMPQAIRPAIVTASSYFNRTPGGFVPIASSATGNIKVAVSPGNSGDSVPAARKLNLPDIRAFS